MAPTKAKSGSAKSPGKRSSKPSTSRTSSKSKSRPSAHVPTKEQKSKPAGASAPRKKKRRVYTDKELGIPKLNMITPAGVGKAKGRKKGKVFVDDQESMMTILAMVNADKEGQIESKMMKARQMEEIRQARQREMEARQQEKKSKLEDTKNSLRRQRKPKVDKAPAGDVESELGVSKASRAAKKRVAFA